jgi:hypothetical protein
VVGFLFCFVCLFVFRESVRRSVWLEQDWGQWCNKVGQTSHEEFLMPL